MSWSSRIARIAEIDIKIHATFFLILILAAFQWGSTGGAPGALFGVVLMLLLFACVTLHELGHSLVAKAFHIPVRQIVLLPLGGVAMLSRMPESPWQEILVAAAGPAVNVVIAAVLFIVLGGGMALGVLDGHGLVSGGVPALSLTSMLGWLLIANVSLVLFNLIPAFPLDGGRILRALLALFMPYAKATRYAALTGQLAAVGLGVLAILWGHVILGLVAVFIFFGAGAESAEAQAKSVLKTLRVGDAYNKHALTLAADDRLSRVVDFLLTSYQPDFAVLHGGRLLGVVTRADVLKALTTETENPYVTGIMQREPYRVDASATLEDVKKGLNESGAPVAAVYQGDRYLGLVSQEDIAEALLVLSFVQRREASRRPAA